MAEVDPLLLLVSELKKQEEAERLARTEADAERLAAEKEAEQEERALDDDFDDDRSYEVGDDYREVDLEAWKQSGPPWRRPILRNWNSTLRQTISAPWN